jgi:drug/metabolite transporter (DMT)-like permease
MRDRPRTLQALGLLSGFAAGAWLGGAEAPTKLVVIGLAPVVISLVMVVGVFLARWSLPALIEGTAGIGAELRAAPHLVVWAVIAGCLWAVANTLTIFAIRDVGLSIAFPLWNSNSLFGILWGVLFFNELRGAGARGWLGVAGGAGLMFAGGALVAAAAAGDAPAADARRGIAAALAAGVLWGTMYIPYRKAYLTGMSPLAFVTCFTIGELGMMGTLAVRYSGGVGALSGALHSARGAVFWLLLGGFIWVVGDLFQQYAAKYAGISRGIPLSNTNQLWGLLWGVLVFGELRGKSGATYAQTIGGSLLMLAGAALVAGSAARGNEEAYWRKAAEWERARYAIDPAFGAEVPSGRRRTALDLALMAGSLLVFAAAASAAERPSLAVHWGWAAALLAAMLVLLIVCGRALWRTTRLR